VAYKNIDRYRLRYLLNHGVSDHELRKFFADCRNRLIAAGAKVQNPPVGHPARAHCLAFDLPSSTDDIVRGWFEKNVHMVDPEPVNVVIGAYKASEINDEPVSEESDARFARSCLVHLFKDAPSDLIEFLRSPIGNSAAAQPSPTQPSPEMAVAGKPLAAVMVAISEGSEVEEHLDGLPPSISTLALGIQAVASGDTALAEQAVESLGAGAPYGVVLSDYLRREFAKRAVSEERPRGVIFGAAKTYIADFDYEAGQVVGYCTKSDPPNAVFVHPIGVLVNGQFEALSDDARRRFFPLNGDLIAFPGSGYPSQPRRGQLGIWRVAEHETQKPTRFHIRAPHATVYEVFSVPISSTDYDAVRAYLMQEGGARARSSMQPVLFQLSDGLVIGARGDRSDLSRAEVFEAGLHAWAALPGFRFEGRTFVPGPLPPERFVYECAGLGFTLRRLFRNGGSIIPGGITRTQMRELAAYLESPDHGTDSVRVERLRADLEKIGSSEEALDQLVPVLLNTTFVKDQIARAVEQESARRLAEKSQLQSDIAKLQRQRSEWDDRIKAQEAEHKRLKDETIKLVRAAFKKAKDESVATLADVAVFQAVAGMSTGTPQSAAEAPRVPAPALLIRALPAEGELDASSVLQQLGVSKRRAFAIATMTALALKHGLIVCIKGIAARIAAERLARVMGGGVALDANVGMVDSLSMSELFSSRDAACVCILDANLSALDIYARPVFDLTLNRLTDSTASERPSFLLSMTNSVGALPYPSPFKSVSIVLDLDARSPVSTADDLEDLRHEVFAPDAAVTGQLWEPALETLKSAVSELPEDAQLAILPLLLESG
jgi:hypothetical protein